MASIISGSPRKEEIEPSDDGTIDLRQAGPDRALHGIARSAERGPTSPFSHAESPQPNSLRRRLVIGDLTALGAAWAPQALLHHGHLATNLACAVVACAATIAAMHRSGLYRARVCAVRSLEVVRVTTAAVVGAAVFAASEWQAGTVDFVRTAEGLATAIALVQLMRWLFGRWLKMKRSAGQFLRTVVLVGTNDDAVDVWHMLNDEPELGYRVGAVVGKRRPDSPWEGLPTCSNIDLVLRLATSVGANGLIIVSSSLASRSTTTLVNRALDAGLHVQIWPGLGGMSSRRVRMSPVLGAPVLYVEARGVAPWAEAMKRAMDIGVTLALLPFAVPLLLACAAMIKLEDRGPVLYRHHVIGRHGHAITVLKLRTMVPDAAKMLQQVAGLNERTGGPLFKASYDPRVTKVGRFLRSTSIDELPQLWNVLNGTMSLVGPRFALPAEAEHFDQELRRRNQMRPGMTGLWQSEARDNPSFSAYRRLDLYYVDNWSPSLDVAILANTAHQVAAKAFELLQSACRGSRPREQVPDDTAPEKLAANRAQAL